MGKRQFWIEHNGAKEHGRVAACHFQMRLAIYDDGVRLRFGSRARGGGNANHGQQRSGGFAIALIVVYLATATEKKVGCFGRVHAAAAAQRHNNVWAFRGDELACFFDMQRVGVLFGAVKDWNPVPRCFQQGNGTLWVAGGAKSEICENGNRLTACR